MYMMNFPNVHDYMSMGKTRFQFVARQHQHMQLLTLVFVANSGSMHCIHLVTMMATMIITDDVVFIWYMLLSLLSLCM